jgi:replicative DNA helicase
MEQEAYRHVPYDIEVEQALLGAILVDNQAIERISSILKPEDFYDPLHERIYDVMVSSADRGGMVLTPLTLHAAMKADPGLMEVGGHAYLAGLVQAAPAMPNVRDYARILHDLAVRRTLIRIGEDIVNTAYEAPHDKPPKAQIEEAEKALYQVSESSKYGAGPIDFAEAFRSDHPRWAARNG